MIEDQLIMVECDNCHQMKPMSTTIYPFRKGMFCRTCAVGRAMGNAEMMKSLDRVERDYVAKRNAHFDAP